MNTPNTELQRGLELMQAKFPGCFVQIEERLYGADFIHHEYRLSLVDPTNTAYGRTLDTIDAAFAAVVADYEKPRTEEINRAKALLVAEGFEVIKTEQ